jgi:RNA polymerase sigma factor (sigma-70 family)
VTAMKEQSRLPEDNLGLVFLVVSRLLAKNPVVRRLGKDEAVSAGNVGLVKACNSHRFDPARGRFSTFACQAIRREILQHATQYAAPVRVPSYHDRSPRVGSTAKMRAYKEAARRSRYFAGGEADSLPARDEGRRDDTEENVRLSQRLLCRLHDEDVRKALRLKFYAGLGLKEIGEYMGVSHERVRQLQHEGLAQLRAMMGLQPRTKRKAS